ncbi:hypothetical protein JJV70_14475 [Streptomyces sp. JJ66]|uniref:hypothetical protein n=1 Tax=Streptomyces sp. JJ66 TaxID=2803843 RepID=UPI001C58CC2C|nr:hypothetical protein [Streptomyces sp. JJ66]MBW1603284.1 hypothetical protein [Streptomyces sp. JJ66]
MAGPKAPLSNASIHFHQVVALAPQLPAGGDDAPSSPNCAWPSMSWRTHVMDDLSTFHEPFLIRDQAILTPSGQATG